MTTTYTEHVVRADRLRLNDVIEDGGEKYVIFFLSTFTGSIREIHARHIDNPDATFVDRVFSNTWFKVYMPM